MDNLAMKAYKRGKLRSVAIYVKREYKSTRQSLNREREVGFSWKRKRKRKLKRAF